MDYHDDYFKDIDQLWGARAAGSSFTKNQAYRGIRILKNPFDLWNYQELIWENDIQWIVECGTHSGGSALYFGDLLALNRTEGLVITIDIADVKKNQSDRNPHLLENSKLRFLVGSSVSASIRDEVENLIQKRTKPLLLILDSHHSSTHVFAELETYIPLLKSGDYLVVEDTAAVPGPRLAIRRFTEENPDLLERDLKRENKMGFTFYPEGYYRVK